MEELRQAGGELLQDVRLFDLYRGASILSQKSLAYALTFRAPDRTLTDEEVAEAVGAIELHLAERLAGAGAPGIACANGRKTLSP